MCAARPLVGFKLPLEWREMQREGRLPSLGAETYTALREIGLDFCEFGLGLSVGADRAAVETLRLEVTAAREHGLAVALHPGPEGQEGPTAAWFGADSSEQPGVDTLLPVLQAVVDARGKEVPIVLHPAQLAYNPHAADVVARRKELVLRSRLFLMNLVQRVGEMRLPVRVTAEHQLPPDPGEPLIRIGDTCVELLDTVLGTGAGICWDTGHYMLAVERGRQPLSPPEEFLRLTEHVHLHDVVAGRDHHPIGRNSGRIRDFLGLLRERGFAGWVTLEYALENILARGDTESVLADSVSLARKWLGIGPL